MVGNNHAIGRAIDWLETVMPYTGLWIGWKQSCYRQGYRLVGNSYAIGRAIDWLQIIMLYSCVSAIEIHLALIVF